MQNNSNENAEKKESFEGLEYVPLTNDLLFHMVFTKNEKALRSLLSCLLNIPEEKMGRIEILKKSRDWLNGQMHLRQKIGIQ